MWQICKPDKKCSVRQNIIITQPLTPSLILSPVTGDWSSEPGLTGLNLSEEASLAPAPTWLQSTLELRPPTERDLQLRESEKEKNQFYLVKRTLKPFLAEVSLSTQEGGWPHCVTPMGQESPVFVTSRGGFTNVSPTSSQTQVTALTQIIGWDQAQGPGPVTEWWWGLTPSTVRSSTGNWALTQTPLTEGLFCWRKAFGHIFFNRSVFEM